MIRRAYMKAIGVIGFSVLNVITLGTTGNIAVHLGWDREYEETFGPTAAKMGMSYAQFRWFASVLNTVTLGLPALAMAICNSISDIKRAYDWKKFMEFRIKV